MIHEITELEPLTPFRRWFAAASAAEDLAEAMTLATATRAGAPSLRAVLLRGFDERGFVFYTNTDSSKAAALDANPRAALCFHWKSLARQVRVEGDVARVADSEADAYFATRARESQIGAWASLQSSELPNRRTLLARAAVTAAKFAGRPIPRPPHWSGFRVVPDRIEFWTRRPFRLHDRQLYLKQGARWILRRLYP